MKTTSSLWLLLVSLFAVTTAAGKEVDKPTGAYASKITPRAVDNPLMQGGLVRVTWSEIEPEPGKFDFAPIERQVAMLKSGMNWTLAIHGGWTSTVAPERSPRSFPQREALSPSWLVSQLGVETFSMRFRANPVEMPKYWNPVVQQRLQAMLKAVGEKYNADPRLKLVYVPQMTSNGVEGHFNGVATETLLTVAGINPRDRNAEQQFGDLWVKAASGATQSVMKAFPDKAAAFEVHELFRSAKIPARLIEEFQKPEYEDRVGIAMWWISGKTNYQGDLITLLKKYQGDLYGQVIGRSDQQQRFPNGDYTAVFRQAEELRMRYIEPWNYEFENRTCDDAIKKFNAATKAKYATP
ncbi:hypothetical protein [Blastopirellula retiformator]|uniref:Glycoside hydrolase family 42 N-terminal domain-containing protein n=1 Tax=Blastopirellula retiformator TaxID=2527970 RepID=A0A5C5VME3_9BACT|nr:hypothetical protein [Blastopirellula retiformator]TWT38882.1 hypothetical protein Enr8_05760 [Blastopirellula retiformator]